MTIISSRSLESSQIITGEEVLSMGVHHSSQGMVVFDRLNHRTIMAVDSSVGVQETGKVASVDIVSPGHSKTDQQSEHVASSDGIPENEFFVLKRRIKNACEKKYRKRRNHKGTRII